MSHITISRHNNRDDTKRVTVTCKDAAGVTADPSALVARIVKPDGTATTYTYGTDAELVKSGTGVYYVDVPLTQAGTWHVRFKSTTGTITAASHAQLIADPDPFG